MYNVLYDHSVLKCFFGHMDWDCFLIHYFINDAELCLPIPLQFQKDALPPPSNVAVESAWVRSIRSVTASKTAKTVRMSCAAVSMFKEWHIYLNLTDVKLTNVNIHMCMKVVAQGPGRGQRLWVEPMPRQAHGRGRSAFKWSAMVMFVGHL